VHGAASKTSFLLWSQYTGCSVHLIRLGNG
jgi:hypothetical protein